MALSFTFVKHLAHLKDNNIAVKINQILVSGQQLRQYVTPENPCFAMHSIIQMKEGLDSPTSEKALLVLVSPYMPK